MVPPGCLRVLGLWVAKGSGWGPTVSIPAGIVYVFSHGIHKWDFAPVLTLFEGPGVFGCLGVGMPRMSGQGWCGQAGLSNWNKKYKEY